mmetsp:Transcript_170843/g.542859  ORF Transcript_170843/g.542859 Transcript_170843/m.542859 type:complete len:534 (-) Transcript_170843:124-1725(-)
MMSETRPNLRAAVSQANQSCHPLYLVITGFPSGSTDGKWNRQVAVMSADCEDTVGLKNASEVWKSPGQWDPSQLCWNHLGLNGKSKPCTHDAKCKSLHISDRALLKYFKSVPCMNVSPMLEFEEGKECRKEGCPYAHSLQELSDSPIKLTTVVPDAPKVMIRKDRERVNVDPKRISYTVGAASLVVAQRAEIRSECHYLSCPFGLMCENVHLQRTAAVPQVKAAAAGVAKLAPPKKAWGPPPPPPKVPGSPKAPPMRQPPIPPLPRNPSDAPLAPEAWVAEARKPPNPWEPNDANWLKTMMIEDDAGLGYDIVQCEQLNWNSLRDVVDKEEDLVRHERGLLWDFIPRYEAWWKQSLESAEHHKAQIVNNILFYPQCILGSGATSSVCLGFRLDNKTPVAVKRFKIDQSKALQELLALDDTAGHHNEIALLTRRQLFRGIVRYVTHFTMKLEDSARPYDAMCIVMDCLNSDLYFVISCWKQKQLRATPWVARTCESHPARVETAFRSHRRGRHHSRWWGQRPCPPGHQSQKHHV